MLTPSRWSLALTETPASRAGSKPAVSAGKHVSRSLGAARTAAEDCTKGSLALAPARPRGGLRKPLALAPARPRGGLWKLLWVLPLCRGICIHLHHSQSHCLLVTLLAAVAPSWLLLQRRLPGVLAAPVGRTRSGSMTRVVESARGHHTAATAQPRPCLPQKSTPRRPASCCCSWCPVTWPSSPSSPCLKASRSRATGPSCSCTCWRVWSR